MPPSPDIVTNPTQDALAYSRCLRRRQVQWLSTSLVGGCIVTVLVAWTIALFVDIYEVNGSHRSGMIVSLKGTWQLSEWRRPGGRLWASQQLQGMTAGERVSANDPREVAPLWLGLQDDYDRFLEKRVNYELRRVNLTGWPFPCLWHENRVTERGASSGVVEEQLGGIATPLAPWRFANGVRDRVVPLKPRVGPFVANVLMYAAVIWCIPGSILSRKTIRLKRGRCPHCAYDLRADFYAGCPECGWNRG